MQRALVVSRLAMLGLALVLLALSGFTIWSQALTQSVGQQVQAAVRRDELFQHARYAITLEAAQEHAYAEGLDRQRIVRFDAAAGLARGALQGALRSGEKDGRAAARTLLTLNERYDVQFHRLVAVAQTGDLAHLAVIEATDLDPLLTAMETRASRAASAQHQLADTQLRELARTDAFVRVSTIGVFTLGIALLAIFSYVLRAYRRRGMQAELAYLSRAALRDHLTDLGNHRAFQEALERHTAHHARHGGALSLALIDLDDFKLINDQHGHTHGDRVLTALGTLLQDGRVADMAFRLGGDEFAILLPQTTLPGAVGTLTRIHRDAKRHLFGATLSIGIATLGADNGDGSSLREEADAALYEAKRRGRNTIVLFDEIKEGAAITSTTKILAVRRLLEARDVSIAFQPIWDLGERRILAFEALLRFPATYELAGPQDAFDIAEKMGRAQDLDAVCREAILARAAELPHDALLFINVSPQTLDHDVLAGTTLQEAVAAAGLTPERVVLELTERSLARVSVVVREAKRLRALGFRLALDDTGAGNAGLRMLSHLPVDFIKVDRDVVVAARTDPAARGVMSGIVALAHETGAYVIAEGIEDQAMLDLIRRHWCTAHAQRGIQGVQGYLLGRPAAVIPSARMVADFGAALNAA